MIIATGGGSGSQMIQEIFHENNFGLTVPDSYHLRFSEFRSKDYHKKHCQAKIGYKIKVGNNVKETLQKIVEYEENHQNSKAGFSVLLRAWPGREFFKDIVNIPVIWFMRDPINTFISVYTHHGWDMKMAARDFNHFVNWKSLIDVWLDGPVQFHRNFYINAINDKNGYIVRYENLGDWKKVFQNNRFKKWKPLFKSFEETWDPKYNKRKRIDIDWDDIDYIKENTKEYWEWNKGMWGIVYKNLKEE